jgi:hypothetical protein
MNETYLIFQRLAHAVIYFVQASSVNEAIWKYISEENDDAVLQADGSVNEEGRSYPHPLAYIEANEKIHYEWQIRRLPEWVWQREVVEAFCGESDDGPAMVIADCRKRLRQAFPRSRAKAFVWYLKKGTLVTFYRRQGAFRIKVLKRYLWDWDGKELTVEDWDGGYQEILDGLDLEPFKPRVDSTF